VNGERGGKLLISVFWAGGSVCGRKADNVVMRQVEGQRKIKRRTRDRKRF
jgi:hypothetical protein